MSEFDNDTLSEAGEVSRDECFERARYFLERVIPVAEEYRVQMACHLDDPPAPVLRGVERWNWPVMEGLTRFSELVDSDYHGFNFCCGVASEGLEDPGRELCDIVRRFGQRKKLFNIHFRNIKGGLHDFQEVWPDEGDVDMHEVARVLHEVGYPYMLMPDHAPHHPGRCVHRRASPDACARPGPSSSATSPPWSRRSRRRADGGGGPAPGHLEGAPRRNRRPSPAPRARVSSPVAAA